MVHVIYSVRPGENEELRYSLRSIAQNLDVDKVTIVGDAPDWVQDVEVLEGNPTDSPDWNTAANIITASTTYKGEFLYFNDDFFALQPVDDFPLWYSKPINVAASEMRDPRSKERVSWYQATDRYLRGLGFASPLSYELHLPLPVVGQDMLRILDAVWGSPRWEKHPGLWRSLYGNFTPAIGNQAHEQRSDVKIHSLRSLREGADFISTDEKTWRSLIPFIQETFPNASPWERS